MRRLRVWVVALAMTGAKKWGVERFGSVARRMAVFIWDDGKAVSVDCIVVDEPETGLPIVISNLNRGINLLFPSLDHVQRSKKYGVPRFQFQCHLFDFDKVKKRFLFFCANTRFHSGISVRRIHVYTTTTFLILFAFCPAVH